MHVHRPTGTGKFPVQLNGNLVCAVPGIGEDQNLEGFVLDYPLRDLLCPLRRIIISLTLKLKKVHLDIAIFPCLDHRSLLSHPQPGNFFDIAHSS